MTSERRKIIHALTFCDDRECRWQENLVSCNYDMQKMRNSINQHIKATGHKVTLETAYTSTYAKD